MLLSSLKSDTIFTPYMNTGTMFDLSTGKFVPSVDGKWLLDGGLGLVTGITGRAQTYKSGIAGSLLSRALTNYPKSEAVVYETEFTIPNEDRYNDFIQDPVSNRIVFRNRANLDLGDWFELLKGVVEMKEKNKKDLIKETPFLDINTGKPQKAWVPTYILCDSWSKAGSSKEDESYAKGRVDDASMNMLYMYEGGVKTKIMRALPTLAHKYGLRFILTGHVGDKKDLNPYNVSPKQLQYMKNNDKMKNVGSEFEFLTTTLMQVTGTSVLWTSDRKNCLYPRGDSPLQEVNEIDGVIVRGKNNAAGGICPFVVSQYQGVLNSVTNFHFLRTNKDYGLNPSGRIYYSNIFTPDKKITRESIREVTDKDYELCRALELIAQICFIKNYWPSFVYACPHITIDIEKIAEVLTASKSTLVSDILNSTGVWCFKEDTKNSRPYLSAWDVLELLFPKSK